MPAGRVVTRECLPGFLLGTSWTVRSAMLMYKEEKKKCVRVLIHGTYY